MMLTRVAMSPIQAVTHRKMLLTLVPSQQPRGSLMCSDTKEAAINSACKKFWKKVWASCSITKGFVSPGWRPS